MQTSAKTLISGFIEQIWNNRNFQKMDEFLHPNFKDYSLPATLPANQEGSQKWILGTGISFEHQTIIEDLVTEGEKGIVKIKMKLKHIGVWRQIEPTGMEIEAAGYRFFLMKDGKIIEHAALIDGQAIENQLKKAAQGCKIAQ
ncbi:ester cyclase [Adhaeribacter radiodurans]|uniref:Ester cyclase n=1 Tax=Adhaeribacter radiodurans TaxID=2745197 RepID=A0A7L7L4C0_9BACT|nr:ester cyclase [Adhaeribacter radiodurans]QMU27661.1 ester cyclase [Adhaeribacter radiodurans]